MTDLVPDSAEGDQCTRCDEPCSTRWKCDACGDAGLCGFCAHLHICQEVTIEPYSDEYTGETLFRVKGEDDD